MCICYWFQVSFLVTSTHLVRKHPVFKIKEGERKKISERAATEFFLFANDQHILTRCVCVALLSSAIFAVQCTTNVTKRNANCVQIHYFFLRKHFVPNLAFGFQYKQSILGDGIGATLVCCRWKFSISFVRYTQTHASLYTRYAIILYYIIGFKK